ncbi:RidA family protein [Pseudomonas typographi]|uniref:RidA family protein n=1 Tax=Pseudomonas typographi TaxID=2715964 RepID=A0ABR7ZA79_9PSED|nr:RidA family protein [Pseudomonas typographi]MBD1602214.1 RidA family protein [Pseudomonas typographi]
MTATKREIFVPGMGPPLSHYCDAVAFGDLLFVSGILPLDDQLNLVGGEDPQVQAKQVFTRLEQVLAAEGAAYADILKVTLFLTDVNDRAAINAVRKLYFGDSRPASTLVEVSGLITPGARLEVEAIARLQRT